MKTCFNEDSVVVTYRESEPTSIIQQFRHAQTKWIISVGMISEGTNIPRLQVCCHLTNIKTEMHFRQILGRILRMTNSKNQEAIMYMPAEPKLLEYAYRVKQDVPFEANVVKFEKMKSVIQEDIEGKDLSAVTFDKKRTITPKVEVDLNGFDDVVEQPEYYGTSKEVEEHFLTSAYERVVNISGRFQQEAIALGLSELR
jgi:superfamily II DNA or RNA helicase